MANMGEWKTIATPLFLKGETDAYILLVNSARSWYPDGVNYMADITTPHQAVSTISIATDTRKATGTYRANTFSEEFTVQYEDTESKSRDKGVSTLKGMVQQLYHPLFSSMRIYHQRKNVTIRLYR